MMMKRILPVLCGLLLSGIAMEAQVRLEPNFSPNKFEVGFGYGVTRMYGDLDQHPDKNMFDVKLVKNIRPYLKWDLEMQHGVIASSEKLNHWTTGLSNSNSYSSLQYSVKVGLGQFIKVPYSKLNLVLNALYVGTGAGFINSNQTQLTTKFKTTDVLDIPSYEWKKNDNTVFVPMNVGINFPLRHLLFFPGVVINLNYAMNYTFSDFVDGYKFKQGNAHDQYNDAYSVFNVNLLFNLGHFDSKTYFY